MAADAARRVILHNTDPGLLSLIASDIACRVILHNSDPRFLSQMSFYDVASNICPALLLGPVRHSREAGATADRQGACSLVPTLSA
jgi:hypothetical protein